LNSFFTVGESDPWRNQEITIYLKVPDNKVIYLDKNLESILFEADNNNNTLEQDMLGRNWRMTSSGLDCMDCSGLKDKKSNNFKND
jgi:hypothetical protein